MLNDYEAENLAEHIEKGRVMARRLAMELVGSSLKDDDLFKRIAATAVISGDDSDLDLNALPAVDRAHFVRFATYGALRLELALMRHQQRTVDDGGDLRTRRDLLRLLLEDLEHIA